MSRTILHQPRSCFDRAVLNHNGLHNSELSPIFRRQCNQQFLESSERKNSITNSGAVSSHVDLASQQPSTVHPRNNKQRLTAYAEKNPDTHTRTLISAIIFVGLLMHGCTQDNDFTGDLEIEDQQVATDNGSADLSTTGDIHEGFDADGDTSANLADTASTVDVVFVPVDADKVTDTETDTAGVTEPHDGPAYFLDGDCDPLVPTHCGLPFPSNVYTRRDPKSPTGLRVKFGETTLVKTKTGIQSAPGAFEDSDGFSPSPMILAHFPGAVSGNLVGPLNIADSILETSSTVVINATTGRRIPHFAELDSWSTDDSRRALIIYPAIRLEDASRYIVAIRGITDTQGELIPASDVFAALRDSLEHEHPTVQRRRNWYEDIFARLATAGVDRGSLQLAWDFTTASQSNNTKQMLHMRDVAFAQYGAGNAPYVFDKIDDNVDEHIARRIEGRITVPLFLDQPGPGGTMTFGSDGLPQQNGTAEYPFLILIPHSVINNPGRLIQFGHGLFGSRFNADSKDYRTLSNQYQFVVFATDFIGMSNLDPPVIGNVILSGAAEGFRTVPDRSQQGFLNMLVLMRNMLNSMANDPVITVGGQTPYLTDIGYYLGGSQGGIYGASYLSLSQDIVRGVLAVPGQSYALMLPRSIHFIPFQGILSDVYADPIDHMFILSVVQMLWDRAEPSGYAYTLVNNPLPNTPAHEVLIIEALGDHQVPNLSTELLARSIGAAVLEPSNSNPYGITAVTDRQTKAVMVDIDYGLPPVPTQNQPMQSGDDPHGKAIDNLPVLEMTDMFYKTGTIQQLCDGACNPE